MNGGHVAAFLFWLIFAGLVLKNWQGANALAGTGAKGAGTIITDLQDK